jgi:hypothetical protein
MIERIAYVSRARPGLTNADVYDLVRLSVNRNSRHGLTGGLLVLDGYFLQVLEGDAHRVDERYRAIAADPRHSALELRLRAPVRERLFADEWMALRLPEQVPAALRSAFGYAPGLPAARFDGARVVDFIHACCRHAAEDATA